MGHYCRICGRTRPNEKFSGKGHRNHICKDCSRIKAKKSRNEEYAFSPDLKSLLDTMPPDAQDREEDNLSLITVEFEKHDAVVESNDDLPF
ncbi:hypothetical protein [Sporolactobacillus inulinus]|uniref:hypothetical protein n=1 Tax=Sporolactobacillus inulinus TaxID=2078 RepID=UPI0021CC58FF|nr:hypothetical protein [Sporolactobacillus inulinus]